MLMRDEFWISPTAYTLPSVRSMATSLKRSGSFVETDRAHFQECA